MLTYEKDTYKKIININQANLRLLLAHLLFYEMQSKTITRLNTAVPNRICLQMSEYLTLTDYNFAWYPLSIQDC